MSEIMLRARGMTEMEPRSRCKRGIVLRVAEREIAPRKKRYGVKEQEALRVQRMVLNGRGMVQSEQGIVERKYMYISGDTRDSA